MGANQSCCAYSSPRTGPKKEKSKKKEDKVDERYEPRQVGNGTRDESMGNLQHISEREPDDWE